MRGKMGGWLVSFIYCRLIEIFIHIFCKEIYKINIPHPISHPIPQKSHKIPIKKKQSIPIIPLNLNTIPPKPQQNRKRKHPLNRHLIMIYLNT